MTSLDYIKSRRTIRAFSTQPVEQEKLDRIVEAAQYAPSGMNNQSWYFAVVSGAALQKLQHQIRDFFRQLELTSEMPPFFGVCKENALKSDDWSFFYGAPTLLIVANKKGYRNAMADSAAATMNAMIEATELGLGTGWITTLSGNTNQPLVRAALRELGVPEDYDVCTSMSIGYAAESPVATERKSVVKYFG